MIQTQIKKTKIGLGGLKQEPGGLLERLRSYYIAYPDGFWIYSLLITVKDDPKLVHELLDKKRYKSKYLTNLRVSEWFKASIKQKRHVYHLSF